MIINNVIYKLKKIISPYKMAIITVVISVLATAIVSGISSIGKATISSEMNGIGLNGLSVVLYDKNAENVTDLLLYENLATMADVEKITPVIYDYAAAEFSNGATFDTMLWGVARDAQDIVSLSIIDGRMISNTDINSSALVCLVDEEISNQAYKRSNIVGKNVKLTIGGIMYNFKIIGSIKKGSTILNSMSGDVIPNFIYIPYTTMQNISLKGSLDQILLKSDNSQQLGDEITKKLSSVNSKYEENTVKLTDLTQQKSQVMKIVNTAFLSLFIVSCVAILVCSISVGASVNTAVSIRQKDIGIKMSLGASRWSITIEFLFSAILACIVGVIISGLIAFIGYKLLSLVTDVKITFDYLLIILSVFATILLTAIFSLFPSYQAANLEPIKALNRE